jgi:hypothetical protein
MPAGKATFGENILHGAGCVAPGKKNAVRISRRIFKLYWHWCNLMLWEVLFARCRSGGWYAGKEASVSNDHG